MATTHAEIEGYFSYRERYFAYLQLKLGGNFKGNARDANGFIKTNGYFDPWSHLSSIENRIDLYKMFPLLLDGKTIALSVRSGSSCMTAETNDEIFPKARITGHVNNDEYGRKKIGDLVTLWHFNEAKVK